MTGFCGVFARKASRFQRSSDVGKALLSRNPINQVQCVGNETFWLCFFDNGAYQAQDASFSNNDSTIGCVSGDPVVVLENQKSHPSHSVQTVLSALALSDLQELSKVSGSFSSAVFNKTSKKLVLC